MGCGVEVTDTAIECVAHHGDGRVVFDRGEQVADGRATKAQSQRPHACGQQACRRHEMHGALARACGAQWIGSGRGVIPAIAVCRIRIGMARTTHLPQASEGDVFRLVNAAAIAFALRDRVRWRYAGNAPVLAPLCHWLMVVACRNAPAEQSIPTSSVPAVGANSKRRKMTRNRQ